MLHNRYREFGGEDAVLDAEVKLLQANGVEVQVVLFNNEVELGRKIPQTIEMGRRSAWSADSAQRITQQRRPLPPAIGHIHNFWMRLAAAPHQACQSEG